MTSISTIRVGPDRERFRPRPVLRGWLHLVWFELSLVAGTLLILHASSGSDVVTFSAIVYAVSVSALFGTSALYHRCSWGPRAHDVLQRLDHVMIFALIAGSSTPVFLVALPGAGGVTAFIVVWALAGLAAAIHLAWMNAPEILVGSTFVALGLLGAFALPALWTRVGVTAFVLVLTGGVLYIIGALLYHRRSPDPRPAVFGFHEVFHAFVCAGATAHYIAIAYYLL